MHDVHTFVPDARRLESLSMSLSITSWDLSFTVGPRDDPTRYYSMDFQECTREFCQEEIRAVHSWLSLLVRVRTEIWNAAVWDSFNLEEQRDRLSVFVHTIVSRFKRNDGTTWIFKQDTLTCI